EGPAPPGAAPRGSVAAAPAPTVTARPRRPGLKLPDLQLRISVSTLIPCDLRTTGTAGPTSPAGGPGPSLGHRAVTGSGQNGRQMRRRRADPATTGRFKTLAEKRR